MLLCREVLRKWHRLVHSRRGARLLAAWRQRRDRRVILRQWRRWACPRACWWRRHQGLLLCCLKGED